MSPKVSIIVPVYGVEKYIGECTESLLAQTYQNLEIILVDDGGKDRSPEICDQYGTRDRRIRVIHKPNGGAASARNAGLDVATGDYICFVDGDDMVRPDYIQHLLQAAMEEEADIAVCGFFNRTRSGSKEQEMSETGTYSREEYLLRFLRDWTCALLWNKIFRREIIGSLRMAEGHRIDDEFFTYRVVMNCHKVVVTDIPLYEYRMRVSGVMRGNASNAERIMLDRIEYITTRYGDIAKSDPDLEQVFFCDVVDTMTRHWRSSKNMPAAQKRIRKWVNNHFFKILRLNISLKLRLVYLYTLYFRKPIAQSSGDTMEMNVEECFD